MPDWTKPPSQTRAIGVLLFERFSNLCLANAIEPLRAANALSGRRLYSWEFLTPDGQPVTSSSGLPVAPRRSLRGMEGGAALFLMPSYGYRALARPPLLSGLRAASRRFGLMAGFDTGAWLMAAAGLLNGHRATIHWDELDAFAEAFPDVTAEPARYVIDGDRVTCSGAMAAYDMVTEMIGADHGQALRLGVGWFLMEGGDRPRAPGRGGRVDRALQAMRETLEEPLPVATIAARAGLGQRALQAAFRARLGATPQTVYRRMRLELARRLAAETDLAITEIALRCGYGDPAAMTRAFAAEFGLTPRDVRRGAHSLMAPPAGRG